MTEVNAHYAKQAILIYYAVLVLLIIMFPTQVLLLVQLVMSFLIANHVLIVLIALIALLALLIVSAQPVPQDTQLYLIVMFVLQIIIQVLLNVFLVVV